MAEFLLNDRINSIRATYYPKTLNIKAEDGAFIRFGTVNGKTGSVRVSFSDPRGNLYSTLLNLGYEVYGDEKSLCSFGTLFQLSGHKGEPVKIKVELHQENEVEEVRPDEIRNIYQEVIKTHARSIQTGQPLSGADALHNLKLVVAAYASASKSGKEITI
jgi:predicted dehydrogenase